MMPVQKLVMLFILMATLMPIRQVLATTDPINDVRIIIDVSGSMKKNDPKNLRQPAVRMIVGLLPENDMSGVWTFAKDVNMLVPYGTVNKAWRKSANTQSKKIHSFGLYTNIEQVLERASTYKKASSAAKRKSIILLSDGLVDISKNPNDSKVSRQRIIDKLLPRLKKANIVVHTIALSDQADHELLKAISFATDGWYEQADSAQELQRIFLNLFEKSSARDTVPLIENTFKIDESITQVTLLVFRKKGSKPTELVLPDNSRFSQQKGSTDVLWHAEGGYDLVTIDNPMIGTWKIDAEVDPDNRVMVITGLKLNVSDLPNNILIGETFDIEASLSNKNKRIERQDFLNFVNATLIEDSETSDFVTEKLEQGETKGLYQSHIGESFVPGRNDVIVSMRSPTFERQRRQSINVIDTPFIINVEKLANKASRTHRITLTPDTTLIKKEGLTIAAMLIGADGSEWSYDVVKNTNEQWQLTLTDLNKDEDYKLALQIRAETQKGRKVFLQPAPIMLPGEKAKNIEKSKSDMAEKSEQAEKPKSEDDMKQRNTKPSGKADPVIDEMAAADPIALPGLDDELKMLDITDDMKDKSVTDMSSSSMMLIIGNVIIVLFIGIGVMLWRRNVSKAKNPGDEL